MDENKISKKQFFLAIFHYLEEQGESGLAESALLRVLELHLAEDDEA
jgi:hypothetical protein